MGSVGSAVDGTVSKVTPTALGGGKKIARGSLKVGKYYISGTLRLILSAFLLMLAIGLGFITGPVGWVVGGLSVILIGKYDGVF